ncbi:MAG: MarR family transcriptional regulator [Paracoccaceae bacterium]|nr:MarR family transcriptional regulator [Paracoccaceae bacterium]
MDKDNDQDAQEPYRLDRQVGFILRRASQRHLSIFSELIPEVTPTQFAVLAKLVETGALSQNALGRITAMDAATIKGVVDRLVKRGLLTTVRDDKDKRRMIVGLSKEGRALYRELEPRARLITEQTLAPLEQHEQEAFLAMLARIC